MNPNFVEITADGRCFRIDLHAKAIFLEKDRRIRLTRQQWDLLKYFIERPPQTLITKNELVDNVWANGASVTDEAVSLAVKSLRRALGAKFIETDHGQGYRLTADVKHLDSDQPPPPPSPTPQEFSDGDWITAALVGPERAEIELKRAAARLNRLPSENRTAISVAEFIESRIEALHAQYAKGGSTDDSRLEACISKVVADLLQRELANFEWNVQERQDQGDPIEVFRNTVKAFIRKHGGQSESRDTKDTPVPPVDAHKIVRAELERLLDKADGIGEQTEAQCAWASEVKRLIDVLLGPRPTNMHSEAFYEFDFATTHAEKAAILRAILLSRETATPQQTRFGGLTAPSEKQTSDSAPNQQAGPTESVKARLSPRKRDELRKERNRILQAYVAGLPHVTHARIFQIDDHTDNGFSLNVGFDSDNVCAADLVKAIRAAFDTALPGVPYWGETLSELDRTVAFGFTYTDHNQKFR